MAQGVHGNILWEGHHLFRWCACRDLFGSVAFFLFSRPLPPFLFCIFCVLFCTIVYFLSLFNGNCRRGWALSPFALRLLFHFRVGCKPSGRWLFFAFFSLSPPDDFRARWGRGGLKSSGGRVSCPWRFDLRPCSDGLWLPRRPSVIFGQVGVFIFITKDAVLFKVVKDRFFEFVPDFNRASSRHPSGRWSSSLRFYLICICLPLGFDKISHRKSFIDKNISSLKK